MRIYVSATSVATACNLNRWQHPAKALDAVLRTHRFGQTRESALKRARLQGGQAAITSIERQGSEGYRHVMEEHKTAPLPSTDKLRDAGDVLRVIRQGKVQIERAIVRLKTESAAAAAAVIAAPEVEVTSEEGKKISSKEDGDGGATIRQSPPVLTAVQKEKRCAAIKKTAAEEVAALQRGRREFESKVARDYGTQQEAATIKKLAQKRKRHVQEENSEILYLVMGTIESGTGTVHVLPAEPAAAEEEKGKDVATLSEQKRRPTRFDPTSWGIGGKLDATMGSTIVETKTRKSRLFYSLPVYERVQLECYMRMKRHSSSLLVERFEETLNEIEVVRSDDFWEKEVVPPLTRFVSLVEWLTQNAQLPQQDAWMAASDIRKQQLYDEWASMHGTTLNNA